MKLSEQIQQLFDFMGTDDSLHIVVRNKEGKVGKEMQMDLGDLNGVLAAVKAQEVYLELLEGNLMNSFNKDVTFSEPVPDNQK